MMENTHKMIGFGIAQINTEQFAILPEAYKESEPSQIRHELVFGIDKENKRVQVQEKARFHNLEHNNPFIIIEVSCLFSIDDENWEKILIPESGSIILPRDFGIHLAMLVVGVLRGILHTKTENTIFNQFIFPPIDVLALVPDDVIFE